MNRLGCRHRRARLRRMVGGAVLVMAVVAPSTGAQATDTPRARGDSVGLFAGLAWSPVRLAFGGGSSEQQSAVAIHLGFRFLPFGWLCKGKPGLCRALSPLALTPHLGYGATHVLGMKTPRDSYAFSFVDLPGLAVTYPLGNAMRLSVVGRLGTHTAERFESGDVVNYWGSGETTVGAVLEVPVVASGRGLEIALLRMRGTFDSMEMLNPQRTEKVIVPVNVRYRATVLQIGWSGPFTGISLPWQ